jgi:hypothetical protein
MEGKITLYCDNKGALQNAFKPQPPGITPTLETDSDLIGFTRALIQLIPVPIQGEWVKGHYNGKDKAFKHELNNLADSLAKEHMAEQPPGFQTLRCPLTYPNYKVQRLMDNSAITSKLYTMMHMAAHKMNIIRHILKKTTWSHSQFDLVHWDSHGQAFKRLSRHQRINTTELIFNLAKTNRQNNLYYGTL